MLKDKRILLYGRHLEDLRSHLPSEFQFVDENPDVIICYGGDGTILGSEREFPEVPKIILRDVRLNPKCDKHTEAKLLQLCLDNKLKKQTLTKIKATNSSGKNLVAINDLVLHNFDPRSAIRYRIWIDGKPFLKQIVGDGVVVATTFGSSAYYKSITNSTFNVGIGLAFNNCTEPIDHIVLNENSVIEIMITRGPALLLADNSPEEIRIEEGEKIVISRTSESATFYGVEEFRCPECYDLRKAFWISKWDNN